MEKMISSPLLINGKIMHHRTTPKKNSFNYKSTYISVPLSKINKLKKSLFSLNKFNLFGFYNSDHVKDNTHNIHTRINQILTKNNIQNISEIVLITHPRILNYVFNPVSFWLCFDKKNQLIAVLSAVNNTCSQSHDYLCFKTNLEPIKGSEWLTSQKEFYVSPFMKIEGQYKFRFEYKNDNMNFYINYLVENKLKLSTSLECSFQELNNRNLFLSFLKIPFATFKTVILIHYQALKLYLKSIKYYKCPEKNKNNLTIGRNE